MFKMNQGSNQLRAIAREKLTVDAEGWEPINSPSSSEDCVPAARIYWIRPNTGERDSFTVLWGDLRHTPAGQ